MANLLTFLRQLWALTVPYFASRRGKWALLFLALIIGLNFGLVNLNVRLSYWRNSFMTSLQERDAGAFWHLMLVFCILAAIYITVGMLQFVLSQIFQIQWRQWLTTHFLERWTHAQSFYRIQLAGHGTDNPDQRIAEDVRMFVEDTLSLSLGFISNAVTLVSFTVILWSLSGSYSFALGGMEISIPGYMFWVALVYSAIMTWVIHKVGKPLIALNFQQQKVEADFRFDLARIREYAEAIALYRGGEGERTHLLGRFLAIRRNFLAIVNRQKTVIGVNLAFSQAVVPFPYIVAAPRYFAGEMQLGDLTQTAGAFGTVQDCLSWFADAYTRLADWTATVQRLTTFVGVLDAVRDQHDEVERPTTQAGLAVRGLHLNRPDGTPLGEAELSVAPGEWVLVSGPSGIGKSTLFRSLAGLWPFARGTVGQPPGFAEHALFLPQKPYIPNGTLRAAVSYPSPPGTFPDAQLSQALTDAGLPDLVARLDEEALWLQRLSGGEQQRLAIARALVQKPAWLFLDEATGSLDEATEASVYAVLRQRLAGAGVVSISHRPELRALHDREVALAPGGTGGFAVNPA